MPPIFYNGIECNDVYFNGVKTTGFLNGNQIWGSESKPIYTLTLQTDGHGTLKANTLTGYAGDTVTLTTAYNTYYRFSGYGVTGGSVAGNVFTFGSADATVKANFKTNNFSASGYFINANTVFSANSGKSAIFYAIVTGNNNVPASYMKAVTSVISGGTTAKPVVRISAVNSSGWCPPSNVSSYYVSGSFSSYMSTLDSYSTYSVRPTATIYSNGVNIYSKNDSENYTCSSYGAFTKTNASPGLLHWKNNTSVYRGSISTGTNIKFVTYPNKSMWVASGIAP